MVRLQRVAPIRWLQSLAAVGVSTNQPASNEGKACTMDFRLRSMHYLGNSRATLQKKLLSAAALILCIHQTHIRPRVNLDCHAVPSTKHLETFTPAQWKFPVKLSPNAM